jgi:hypothetical protein
VREAKKVKENMTPDGGAGYLPPWSLFDAMGFLMDSIRHRKSSSFPLLKRDASSAFTEELEMEPSGDGECLSPGSPGGSSIELNASPSHQPPVKRRKSARLNAPFVVAAPTLTSSPDLRHKEKSTPSSSQLILKSLKALEETVQEQQKVIEDEDELFGKQVAMVMRRLTSKQKATAKLRIQQVFLDVEFPPDSNVN